jgi:hypothetical protein
MNYECSSCGTKYISKAGVPPGVKWSDGHVCTPVLVQEKKPEVTKSGYDLLKHLKTIFGR